MTVDEIIQLEEEFQNVSEAVKKFLDNKEDSELNLCEAWLFKLKRYCLPIKRRNVKELRKRNQYSLKLLNILKHSLPLSPPFCEFPEIGCLFMKAEKEKNHLSTKDSETKAVESDRQKKLINHMKHNKDVKKRIAYKSKSRLKSNGNNQTVVKFANKKLSKSRFYCRKKQAHDGEIQFCSVPHASDQNTNPFIKTSENKKYDDAECQCEILLPNALATFYDNSENECSSPKSLSKSRKQAEQNSTIKNGCNILVNDIKNTSHDKILPEHELSNLENVKKNILKATENSNCSTFYETITNDSSNKKMYNHSFENDTLTSGDGIFKITPHFCKNRKMQCSEIADKEKYETSVIQNSFDGNDKNKDQKMMYIKLDNNQNEIPICFRYGSPQNIHSFVSSALSNHNIITPFYDLKVPLCFHNNNDENSMNAFSSEKFRESCRPTINIFKLQDVIDLCHSRTSEKISELDKTFSKNTSSIKKKENKNSCNQSTVIHLKNEKNSALNAERQNETSVTESSSSNSSTSSASSFCSTCSPSLDE